MKMNEKNSKKEILKASSLIGGASVISIVIGLVKVKTLAVLLGPSGVGFMGILLSLLALASTTFSLGVNTTGVREIALYHDSPEKTDKVRQAIFLASSFLGGIAFILILLFRKYLSEWLFNSSEQEWTVCWVGFGVYITLISGSQSAVLQGFRKIKDLAKIKIYSALISTLLGLFFVWKWGELGITGLVVSVPLISCLFGFYYTSKLSRINSLTVKLKELIPLWKSMVSLGFIFMLSGFMGEGAKLLVRDILNNHFDLQAVGNFQAAWSISMTYIGFVLGAMAADYYPRLTQAISNKEKITDIVNQQTEIALVFSAPILIAMVVFAPLVIRLLYSSDFTTAIEVLRWQVVGDLFKLVAWPLGFVVLAHGKGKVFFTLELIWNLSYLLIVYFGIGYFNVEITGYAFLFSYIVLLLANYIAVSKVHDFSWSKRNMQLLSVMAVSLSLILVLSYYSETITIILGSFACVISGLFALKVLDEIGVENRAINAVISFSRRFGFIVGR